VSHRGLNPQWRTDRTPQGQLLSTRSMFESAVSSTEITQAVNFVKMTVILAESSLHVEKGKNEQSNDVPLQPYYDDVHRVT
jgi:hypothetical protein